MQMKRPTERAYSSRGGADSTSLSQEHWSRATNGETQGGTINKGGRVINLAGRYARKEEHMNGMTAIDYIRELHQKIEQLQRENKHYEYIIKKLTDEMNGMKHTKNEKDA